MAFFRNRFFISFLFLHLPDKQLVKLLKNEKDSIRNSHVAAIIGALAASGTKRRENMGFYPKNVYWFWDWNKQSNRDDWP